MTTGEDNNDPTNRLIGSRFGEEGGADARAAQAKSRAKMIENNSVRRMVNRIAAHEFDTGPDAPPIQDQIRGIFGRKMTGAQMMAAARVAQGMKNYKAMQNIVEDIDGKLIEKKVEAQVSYADLVAGSLDREREEQEATLVDGSDPQES